MQFFSPTNPHVYIAIFVAALNGFLMCLAGYKFLHIIQLSGYKIKAYFLWLKEDKGKYIARLAALSFISTACSLVTNAIFHSINFNEYFSYAGLIFYFYFIILFITLLHKTPKKVALKQTHRMTRFTIALFFFTAGLSFILIAVSSEFIPLYRFGIITLIPAFLIFIVPLIHLLMIPFEIFNFYRYIWKAKRKLKKYPNLIKIGITGSYGKTSVKNFLNKMLSEKYQVCYSPHSFNTPMGITKIVLDYLKPNHEILITEMGAKKKGEIKQLCDIVHPDYGILTGIGNQHFETFGSKENIIEGKYELIEALPKVGIGVFNLDNPESVVLYDKTKIKKISVSLTDSKADCYAKKIKTSSEGSSFTLSVYGDEIDCSTKLLGKHNLLNILLSAALAVNFGISLKTLQEVIGKLESVPHRLELIKNGGNVVLDDSYNANSEGVKFALEVLSEFSEKEKIIVTPGIIELGEIAEEENEKFGFEMAAIATKVIIVNKINLKSLKNGLLKGGFKEKNIREAATLEDAKKFLVEFTAKSKVTLFVNDLPDNYN